MPTSSITGRALCALGALTALCALGCGADDEGSAADAEPDVAVDMQPLDMGADPIDMAPELPPAEEGRPPPHYYPDHPLLQPGPLLIAHRGGRWLGPECTLHTYEMALAVGADVLEADVRLTADGEVVIMHDRTVDRTTDGTGAVSDFTLAELKALDAGYAFGEDEGYPYRGMGLVVPTLGELLAAFPDTPITLEIKQDEPPMIDELLAVLDAHRARGRVAVAAYSDTTIGELRAAAPGMLTALAVGEVIGWISLPPGAEPDRWQPPGHFLQIPIAQEGFELVTAETVAHAQSHGVGVHPYTINDPDEMRWLLELGVAGIMTDDPVTLRALLDGESP